MLGGSEQLGLANLVFQITSQLLPLATALVAIPILLTGLGTARFGLLSLTWQLIGYSGLFDLGVGRALTKHVAEQREDGRLSLPPIIWTGSLLLLGLGIASGATVYVLGPLAAKHWLGVPPAIQSDAVESFVAVSVALPSVLVAAGLLGVLDGARRFRLSGSIRTLMGALGYLTPLLSLSFSHSVAVAVSFLAATRIATAVALVIVCLRLFPRLSAFPSLTLARRLLAFGVSVAVTNTIGSLLIYADRVVVSVLLGVGSVAYFAIPYEVANKATLVPFAFATVGFPTVVSRIASNDPRGIATYMRVFNLMFTSLVPIAVLMGLVGPLFLRLWLGNAAAQNMALPTELLAAATVSMALMVLPHQTLWAMGRPDLSAKLRIILLLTMLPTSWLATRQWGIAGAATIVLARTLLDFSLASILVAVRAFMTAKQVAETTATVLIACLVIAVTIWIPDSSQALRIVLGAVVFMTFAAIGGFRIIGLPHGRRLMRLARSRFPSEVNP